MEATHDPGEFGVDRSYCFDLTLVIHVDDEAEANKSLAKLLDGAENLGFELAMKVPRPI